MSFPESNDGSGGSGGSGRSGQAISLRLAAPAVMNVSEIAKVPFNSIQFNDGFSYSASTKEITIAKAGTLSITASVRCAKDNQGDIFSISCFLFKNDVPIRQHANQSGAAPYASAGLAIIDKCEVGDKYVLYVTRTEGATYSLVANEGLTGLELSYL